MREVTALVSPNDIHYIIPTQFDYDQIWIFDKAFTTHYGLLAAGTKPLLNNLVGEPLFQKFLYVAFSSSAHLAE